MAYILVIWETLFGPNTSVQALTFDPNLDNNAIIIHLRDWTGTNNLATMKTHDGEAKTIIKLLKNNQNLGKQ